MPKRPRTWIVLADGAHARAVTPGERRHFRTVLAFDSAAAHARPGELGAEPPSHSSEGAARERHAIVERTNPREQAKERFLDLVAERICAEAAAGAFDRLVLVAPSHELPDLRAALNRPAAERVVGTMQKDLTKVPDHELGPHLAEWWTPPAEA
jgi:protein required for attachment to host cells